jgi:hypothetical protein
MILIRLLRPLLFCYLSISDPTLAQPHNVLLLFDKQAVEVLLNVRIDLDLLLAHLVFRPQHIAESIINSSEILQFLTLLILHAFVFEDLLSLPDDPLPHLHHLLHVLILEFDDFLEGTLVHRDHLTILILEGGRSKVRGCQRRLVLRRVLGVTWVLQIIQVTLVMEP